MNEYVLTRAEQHVWNCCIKFGITPNQALDLILLDRKTQWNIDATR